ncbi:MAG: hypothetical protein Pg6C_20250 [Treponemataceae bacterium]|nr:MAG: hypothetical protein Pg6C_20250 [Treponemataceae bacterium]
MIIRRSLKGVKREGEGPPREASAEARSRRGGIRDMVKRTEVYGGCLKEPRGEEGRDKLRKAPGRSTYPAIRG